MSGQHVKNNADYNVDQRIKVSRSHKVLTITPWPGTLLLNLEHFILYYLFFISKLKKANFSEMRSQHEAHKYVVILELVSKELNHLAAILHVYAGGLNFVK